MKKRACRYAGRPRPDRCRGFLLMEVLVAFTILALTLGAMFQVFGGGLRAARVGDEYTRAVMFAESRLAALSASAELEEGETGDEIDDRYRWRAVVEPYSWAAEGEDVEEPANLAVQPLLVRVEVSWEEGGDRRAVTLTSLRLQNRAAQRRNELRAAPSNRATAAPED